MDIFSIITLLGGLALFIYGMGVLGQGLEKVAGQKLHAIIEVVTGNIFKSVCVGALVTAAIQSSSATTVMVVGFVNAGIMNLKQAAGIIMGANIGTTVTALLISLNVVSGSSLILKFLKPTTLAPLAVIAGVVMMTISKRKKLKEVGEILIGFGVLFIGLQIMEGAVSSLRDIPQFKEVFATLSNPVLGIIAGALITAVIQSSSASVGILQAVATSGVVTFSNAIPIILGQNIGTCITAILSSIGASKNGKRAACIHLYFNVIGSIIFMIAIYSIKYTIGFSFWDMKIDSFDIAKIHIVFNIVNTLILLPFSSVLVKLANATIKAGPEETQTNYLDERFLLTPSIGLEQARKAVIIMAKTCIENYNLGVRSILTGNISNANIIKENEQKIDKLEYNISQYLVKLNEKGLNDSELKTFTSLFHLVTDLERVGDHCDNLFESASWLVENSNTFSDDAYDEMKAMMSAVGEMLQIAITSYEKNDVALARRIEPIEDIVDRFKINLKSKHVQRLNTGKCTVECGVIYLETISDLERIADHCMNISFYVIQQSNNKVGDMHEYFHDADRRVNSDYSAYLKFYEDKYYNSLFR